MVESEKSFIKQPGNELATVCSDPDKKSARVMINVIKYNQENKADMDQYSNMAVFQLFPKIGSFIFHSGVAVDGYWNQVYK